MKKLITFGFLSVLFVFPFVGSAASVTIETIPSVCSSAVFRGTASYSAPDTLIVNLNGKTILTTSSGDSVWQVSSQSSFKASNLLEVQISSSSAGVIASASRSFGANCGGNDPMSITQVWGLTGHQTPKSRYGQTLTDEFGFTEKCTFFGGCFDIRRTDYYRLPILKYFKMK